MGPTVLAPCFLALLHLVAELGLPAIPSAIQVEVVAVLQLDRLQVQRYNQLRLLVDLAIPELLAVVVEPAQRQAPMSAAMGIREAR